MSGERLPYPTERDVMEAREEQASLRMETAFPARVQAYDSDAETADLVPLIRHPVPQPDGSYAMEDLPVLPSVPVCGLRSGDWFASLPVSPGDTGLVVVCSGAIGHWRVGDGGVTDPGDLRRHHLSHAVFLPVGLVPRSHALTKKGAAGMTAATPTERARPSGIVIGSDATNGPRVLMRANGAVEVETGGATAVRVDPNGTVNLGAAVGAAFVALASHVDARLSAIQAAFDAHGHAVSGTTAAAGAPLVAVAAPPTSPIGPLATVAATKAKAT